MPYSPGEVAEKTGFSIDTLRYYERIGLVAPAGRTAGGYRVYDEGSLARLAFIGATRTLTDPREESVAVIDVGGGSTELAVGPPTGAMAWSASFRIGSGFLADSYLSSDPPSVEELEKVRRHVAGTFEGVEPPPAEAAVAVGGTATSLRRLLGAELSHETLERGIRVLSQTPIEEVADRFELDPERVRLLPAGILVLEALSDLLALPLRIARGGLREGVLLELHEERQAA